MMDIKKIFGSNVRKFRKSRDMSQEELSEAAGVSVKHLSNIEIGSRFISANLLERLCDVLEIPPQALFVAREGKYASFASEKTREFLLNQTQAFTEELINGLYQLNSEEKD
jgi:transcriptional regulator with XRE-family HTH domain